MGYNKDKIYRQALEVAKDKKCFTVTDVYTFLPCSKSTFYEFFPDASEELDAIKEIIEVNRVEIKSAMRNKWFKSDNATLQVALMKLICTDEEAHRLNGSKQEVKTTELKPIFKGIDLSVKGNDSTT